MNTALDDWYQNEEHLKLQQILKDPTLKQALELVRNSAYINDHAILRIAGKSPAADASLQIALASAVGGGILRAISSLEGLTRLPPPKTPPVQEEPFDRFTELK